MKTGPILTIGHSNHTLEFFLELLIRHRVTALADVRSAPYSRFNSHFNRERLAGKLEASGIKYVYLGRELGGRSDDRSCYENGHVRYDRLACKACFLAGLKQVLHCGTNFRVALMCAEKEPLHCHRTLLVGHKLDERGAEVAHILPDGELESHQAAMNRLLDIQRLHRAGDLLNTRQELIEMAINQQARRFAHVDEKLVARTGEHAP